MIIRRLLPWQRPSQGIFTALKPPISPSPCRRRCLHQMPNLTHQRLYENEGVPGLFTKESFDLAWTQYQGYTVARLNMLTEGTPSYTSGVKDLLLAAARQPEHASLFNYASMAHNNNFFFSGLSPTKTNIPDGLSKQLKLSSFTSIDTLRDEMLLTTNSMFGPGFVWLVKLDTPSAVNPEYRILTTYIAGTPFPDAHYRAQPQDAATMPRTNLPVTDPPGGARAMAIANASKSSSAAGTSPNTSTGSKDGGKGNVTANLSSGLTPADYHRQTTYQNDHPGAMGDTSHGAQKRPRFEPILCVNTWQHVWMWDYGIAGKWDYLQAWWERIDWAVVANRSDTSRSRKISARRF
ncbi:MAG: hypothetical protein M1823_003563 [Watsoniomyces obsoletus]|nr:MAG: hypothetical protein M1823_003563 [Watsoniomyces obsoletus]